jgi:hypothetical protein
MPLGATVGSDDGHGHRTAIGSVRASLALVELGDSEAIDLFLLVA